MNNQWTFSTQRNMDIALKVCRQIFPEGSQYCWKDLDLYFIDEPSSTRFAEFYYSDFNILLFREGNTMKLWESDLLWECSNKGVIDWDQVFEELVCRFGYKTYVAEITIQGWKCTFAQTD